jgi:hypothetical protein
MRRPAMIFLLLPSVMKKPPQNLRLSPLARLSAPSPML